MTVSLYKPAHRAETIVGTYETDTPTQARMEYNPDWTGIGGKHIPVRHPIWGRAVEPATPTAEPGIHVQCHLVTTNLDGTNWEYWCFIHEGGTNRPDADCCNHPTIL